jgi:outer membrane lipoprotein-sorting protein
MLLTLSLLMTLGVFGQEKPKSEAPKADAKPAAGMPTVDEILERNIKAIGGEEAIRKITSRSSKGSFDLEAMNISGTFEMVAKAPNRTATTIELPGMGKMSNVFDGTKAYSADPMNGVREPSGTELEPLKRAADFYSSLNYKKNYTKIELKGVEKVGSTDAYVLVATPPLGDPDKLFFDAKTYMLLKSEAERDTPQGKMLAEQFFENYKTLDGVNVATTLRTVTPAFIVVIKLSEIKHNVPVDDAKFAKPGN